MQQPAAPMHVNSIKEVNDGQDYYVQQFSLGCLGQFSYYVESNKQALVIDPIREISDYLFLLNSRGATLQYVLLTHIHADFVAGHLDLAKATGAQIILGPGAATKYLVRTVHDEEHLELGKVKIRVLHTPGHTLESSCYVVESQGKDSCLFTGDTIFLQEVGRPDLAVAAGTITKEQLAAKLYQSLRNKIIPLADDIVLFPGHGAGSSCGKAIGAGSSCTVGKQKSTNYALSLELTEEDFVKIVTDIAPPPQYYFHDANINKQGPTDIKTVKDHIFKPLQYAEVVQFVKDGALILDSREDVTEGIINGSLNISFAATFATFVGTYIKPETQLIVVAAQGKEEMTINRLLRIGYENVHGYLEGGFQNYLKHGGETTQVKVVGFKEFATGEPDRHVFIDVRNPAEFKSTGVIQGAILLPLPQVQSKMDELPKDKVLHIYCRSGARAKLALTFLLNAGFKEFVIVQNGGTEAIAKEANLVLQQID